MLTVSVILCVSVTNFKLLATVHCALWLFGYS